MKYKIRNIKLNFTYLILILIFYVLFDDTSIFLFFSSLISIVFWTKIIYEEYSLSEFIFTPISMFSISLLFMLGIGALYYSFFITDLNNLKVGPYSFAKSSLKVGYLMVLFGVIFQLTTMQILRPKESIQKNVIIYPSRNLYLYFVFFYLIIYLFDLSSLGVIKNFIDIIPLSILTYIILLDKDNIYMNYYKKRKFIFFGSFALIILRLKELSKSSLMFTLLPIILFYISDKNKKKIIIVLFFSFLFYLFFIQPFVNNSRILVSNKYFFDFSVSYIIDYILSGDYLYDYALQNTKTYSYEVFLQRTFEINAPTFIYEHMKYQDFLFGKDWEYILLGLVPRIIWSSKPHIPRGYYFAENFLGQTNVSVGMLPAGELYLNFGWAGIILGHILIGFSFCYLWGLINKISINNIIIYTFYLYISISSFYSSEFGSIFLGNIQIVILLTIINKFNNLLRKLVIHH